MSLAIDPHKVEAMLLPDGKWYAVSDQSFVLGVYEFVEEGKTATGGSQAPGVSPACASWKDAMGKQFVCPLTAILAYRYH